MKLILAYIQPHRLGKVTLALRHLPGFPGMTIVPEAQGFGPLDAADAPGQGVGDFDQVLRLESVVTDELADRVVELLMEAAHTGMPGDGRIFVLEVAEAVRIRGLVRGAQP